MAMDDPTTITATGRLNGSLLVTYGGVAVVKAGSIAGSRRDHLAAWSVHRLRRPRRSPRQLTATERAAAGTVRSHIHRYFDAAHRIERGNRADDVSPVAKCDRFATDMPMDGGGICTSNRTRQPA